MNKTIEVTVAPNGETSVETKGFAGAECRDASRFIEQALGKRTAEQLTVEYHCEQPVKSQLREHHR